MSSGIYLIATSGLFRILQDELRQAWAEELAAGVIAVCPVVELEFLYSARSLADRLEKKRLLRTVFSGRSRWQSAPSSGLRRCSS